MAERSYPQVDGGPSDVILELGRFRDPTPLWVWVVTPLAECALFAWLIFFMPWPLYMTAPVVGAVFLFMVSMPLLSRLLPPSALTTKGVRGSLGTTRWNEILSYSFVDPHLLSMVVVGHTLNAPEDLAAVYCPPELREQALAVLRDYAPKAKLLGRMPGAEL